MASQLYGVKATDAWTFARSRCCSARWRCWQSYIPSRRAMALDPMAALRHDE